jgi:hypothetical protein
VIGTSRFDELSCDERSLRRSDQVALAALAACRTSLTNRAEAPAESSMLLPRTKKPILERCRNGSRLLARFLLHSKYRYGPS